jgi:hypothetical protein
MRGFWPASIALFCAMSTPAFAELSGKSPTALPTADETAAEADAQELHVKLMAPVQNAAKGSGGNDPTRLSMQANVANARLNRDNVYRSQILALGLAVPGGK